MEDASAVIVPKAKVKVEDFKGQAQKIFLNYA